MSNISFCAKSGLIDLIWGMFLWHFNEMEKLSRKDCNQKFIANLVWVKSLNTLTQHRKFVSWLKQVKAVQISGFLVKLHCQRVILFGLLQLGLRIPFVNWICIEKRNQCYITVKSNFIRFWISFNNVIVLTLGVIILI